MINLFPKFKIEKVLFSFIPLLIIIFITFIFFDIANFGLSSDFASPENMVKRFEDKLIPLIKKYKIEEFRDEDSRNKCISIKYNNQIYEDKSRCHYNYYDKDGHQIEALDLSASKEGMDVWRNISWNFNRLGYLDVKFDENNNINSIEMGFTKNILSYYYYGYRKNEEFIICPTNPDSTVIFICQPKGTKQLNKNWHVLKDY